jgi:hypothetical protein
MAKEQGVDPSTVARIWQDNGIQPHRQETFKISRDPEFVAKLVDVVAVYLNPPQNAVVLCVDEKSQIQALDRTQPGLPLKKGRCGTMTHDYKRNGTTTLFAALDIATGTVSGACFPRHRHQEFLRFLQDAVFEQVRQKDIETGEEKMVSLPASTSPGFQIIAKDILDEKKAMKVFEYADSVVRHLFGMLSAG